MQTSGIPSKTPIVWGASAGASYIRTPPNTSQIGINAGAASFPDGFVPISFLSKLSGGVPPDGRDFNGILNVLSAWAQWFQASGPVSYDSSFCASIGGYPKGATLLSTSTAGLIWYNTAENNTTDPDGGSPANWRSWGPATFPAGTTMAFYNSAAPLGWTKVTTLNDVTIRIVNGTGGTFSVSGQAFSTATASGTVDGHAISTAEMPIHYHGVNDPTHNHTTAAPFNGPTTGGSTYVSPYLQTAYTGNSATGITIQNAGSGYAHAHTFTSSALNINYADMILCSKN